MHGSRARKRERPSCSWGHPHKQNVDLRLLVLSRPVIVAMNESQVRTLLEVVCAFNRPLASGWSHSGSTRAAMAPPQRIRAQNEAVNPTVSSIRPERRFKYPPIYYALETLLNGGIERALEALSCTVGLGFVPLSGPGAKGGPV